jgi:hypothetical protein
MPKLYSNINHSGVLTTSVSSQNDLGVESCGFFKNLKKLPTNNVIASHQLNNGGQR